jgi:hypothetical protein
LCFVVAAGVADLAFSREAKLVRTIEARTDMGSARWCGTHEVVWKNNLVGISTMDMRSGEVSVLTRSFDHEEPVCSGDARFVLFRDARMKKYFPVERATSTVSEVPCLGSSAHVSEDLSRVVELQDLRTAQSSCSEVVFPWGSTVRIEKLQVTPFQARFARVAAWPSAEELLLHLGRPFRHGEIFGGTLASCSSKAKRCTSLGLPVEDRRLYRLAEGVLSYLEPDGSVPGEFNLALKATRLSDPNPTHIASKVIAYDRSPAGFLYVNKAGQLLSTDLQGRDPVLVHKGPWSAHLRISPDARRALLVRQDPLKGREGPSSPPITYSIHVLDLN